MRIQINGEPREVSDGLKLTELVDSLSLKAEQVAVELNCLVVRRAQWEATILKTDDRIEIVHFVGGGRQMAGGRI